MQYKISTLKTRVHSVQNEYNQYKMSKFSTKWVNSVQNVYIQCKISTFSKENEHIQYKMSTFNTKWVYLVQNEYIQYKFSTFSTERVYSPYTVNGESRVWERGQDIHPHVPKLKVKSLPIATFRSMLCQKQLVFRPLQKLLKSSL